MDSQNAKRGNRNPWALPKHQPKAPDGLGRRRFLKQMAAASGAVVLPEIIPSSALGKDAAVPPSDRITLGCIGVGGQGGGLLKNFLFFKDVRVLAVCDAYEDRRLKAKQRADAQYGDKGCTAYLDYREVLARKDIDAVVIAAQDHWHALIATAAAQAGKDIYCEKPLGASVQESQAIREAVRKHRRVFQTGTQQRSDSKFRFACELARNGYVGKGHTVQVATPGPNYHPKYNGPLDPQLVPKGFDWDTWLGPAPRQPYNPGRVAWPDWYLIWDYCAGFIVNWGVHHLDIALWGCPELAGEPFEVNCQAVYRKKGFTDNVESWNSTFTCPGGLKMVFTDSQKQKTGCRFIGDKGWVHVDRSGIWAQPESLLKVKIKPQETHLHKSDNHGDDFLKSIRNRKDPVSDVDSGHRASYFGMVADIAARLGRKLRWDPKKELFVGADDANAMLTRPMREPWKL